MTPPSVTGSSSDDEPRFLLVHPVLWPDLVSWLEKRGLTVGLLPPEMQVTDTLTYTHTPVDELLGVVTPQPGDGGESLRRME